MWPAAGEKAARSRVKWPRSSTVLVCSQTPTLPFLDVASFFKYTPGILSSSGDAKLGQRAPPGFQ